MNSFPDTFFTNIELVFTQIVISLSVLTLKGRSDNEFNKRKAYYNSNKQLKPLDSLESLARDSLKRKCLFFVQDSRILVMVRILYAFLCHTLRKNVQKNASFLLWGKLWLPSVFVRIKEVDLQNNLGHFYKLFLFSAKIMFR